MLVVDDDDTVRRVVVLGLRRLGYAVEGVGSAAEATARIASGPPYDLIVTDVHLRDGFGTEAVAAAATGSAGPSVLVITGSSDEVADDARRQLPDWIRSGILAKPFSLNELHAAIERLLDGDEGSLER